MKKDEQLRETAKKELQRLNGQIDTLIKQRKEFIDENGYLFAPFTLGQKVINRNNLEFGLVVDYYQYGNDDECFSTHCKIMLCDNEWNPKRIIDNTSCYFLKSEMPWVDFEEYKKEFHAKVEGIY